MPEGDTIFRAARTLHRALAGDVVTSFESVFPALNRIHDDHPITGRTIDRVEAAGKHILIHFSGDLILRTHMRMNGSWHVYRPGERWQRSASDMRIRVATGKFEAVGFNVPVAELMSGGDRVRHRELRALGPDVLSEGFDAGAALLRLRSRAGRSIAEALLDQRAIAGLGNVYKSEVLFMSRVNPFSRVETLDDATLVAIVETARRVLRANVSEGLASMTTYSGFRRTTGQSDPAERVWVYGRARLPCRRCGTPVAVRKHGIDARLTYWCPKCQPE